MDNLVFYNDQYLPESKVKINCRDLGFLRGYGVFDFMIARDTRVHRFHEHYNRFLNSAKNYNLKLNYSETQAQEIIEKLLKKNKFLQSTIRMVLTGGVSSNGRIVEKETFLILIDKLISYPSKYYTEGVKVITREFRRDNPIIKALNYQFAYSLYQTNSTVEAFEIIYTFQGNVLEGATSNIFLVKDNIIATPKEDILMGITRNEVIELARTNKLSIQEREITHTELMEADEIFITATTKKVMPVLYIDNKKLGDICPGPITKKLMELYDIQFTK